jgi:hypothetical protein
MTSDSSFLSDTDLGKLNVSLVYENVSAALWAAELLTKLLRVDAGAPAISFSPRSFGMLGDPSWPGMTSVSIFEADLIVIACTSDQMVLSRSVEKWLETVLKQNGDLIRPAVVAYFRSDEGYDKLSSPRLQTVQEIARQAGCKFFAPFVSHEEAESVSSNGPLKGELTHA